MPFSRISLSLLLVFSFTAACKSPPYQPDPNAQGFVDAGLAEFTRKESLSHFVGVIPETCLKVSVTTELCQWVAGDRQNGWRTMADAIGTRDRVNLICELPLSGDARARGSCSVHPRRSNRYSWKVENSASARRARKRVDPAQVRKRYRETASRWMAAADTVVKLSRLMGAVPNQCTPGSNASQTCIWRTGDHTFGHGTLVVWINASKSKKIRLHCVVPIDGSPRAAESCAASIGA